MAKSKTTYNEGSIRALNFPDNVRTSPSMYVGSVDTLGITHCFREIFDNCTDEIKESSGKRIFVKATKEFVFVQDDGRGIPVGPSKDIKGQSTLTTIFTHLHAGGKTLDTGAYSSARGCFTGDTKIKLLDGTSKRIDELAKEHEQNGTEYWVYAFSKEAAKKGIPFVPRKAYGVFITRTVTELAIVTLNNGEVIRCTPDHPFMLWDGTYKEAQQLKPEDTLRAVHFLEDSNGFITHSGAHKVPNREVTRYAQKVHRTVALAQGLDIEGNEVSHKNAVRHDNRPENLQVTGTKQGNPYSTKFGARPREAKEAVKVCNHKVSSVVINKTDEPVTVYGMSVHQNHNYLLDAGVFVKNTHGVGAAVVNALASELMVWTFRNKKWHHQSFKNGVASSKVINKTVPEEVPLSKGVSSIVQKPKFRSGSAVLFRPDFSIFKSSKIDVEAIHDLVKTAAYFNPGVQFVFSNEKETFEYKTKGLSEFVPEIAHSNKAELVTPVFSYSNNNADIAFAWANTPEDMSKSYVSGGLSDQGGTHQKAFDDMLFEAVTEAGGRAAKKINKKFLKTGIVSVVNVSINHPTFSSQTKSKLTSTSVKPHIFEAKEAVIKFLKNNKDTLKEVIETCLKLQDSEMKFRATVLAATKMKSPRGKIILPTKLTVSQTKNPSERELYILEGDSAAGSAKEARNPKYQEVLPIRGKFSNPYKEKAAKVFSNDSVLSIFQSIGFDPSKKDPLENLRVGRVIFLADADEDGSHINALLTALFSKFLPELFERNMVYVVKAPLFQASYKERKEFGKTVSEAKAKFKNITNIRITRLKGWGEANASDLKVLAFDEGSRHLIRLRPIDRKSLVMIDKIMGEDVDYRKTMLGVN